MEKHFQFWLLSVFLFFYSVQVFFEMLNHKERNAAKGSYIAWTRNVPTEFHRRLLSFPHAKLLESEIHGTIRFPKMLGKESLCGTHVLQRFFFFGVMHQ